MTVELLYLPGCPHYALAAELIDSVLRAEGVPVVVEEVPINDFEGASFHSFPGSPTIRVNGQDVEHVDSVRLPVGFACRTYVVHGMPQGVPPRSWVERAIRTARERESQQ